MLQFQKVALLSLISGCFGAQPRQESQTVDDCFKGCLPSGGRVDVDKFITNLKALRSRYYSNISNDTKGIRKRISAIKTYLKMKFRWFRPNNTRDYNMTRAKLLGMSVADFIERYETETKRYECDKCGSHFKGYLEEVEEHEKECDFVEPTPQTESNGNEENSLSKVQEQNSIAESEKVASKEVVKTVPEKPVSILRYDSRNPSRDHERSEEKFPELQTKVAEQPGENVQKMSPAVNPNAKVTTPEIKERVAKHPHKTSSRSRSRSRKELTSNRNIGCKSRQKCLTSNASKKRMASLLECAKQVKTKGRNKRLQEHLNRMKAK